MTRYVIRVSGRLSDGLLTAFPTLVATVQPTTTLLYGPLPDQAALAGVLDLLDQLGVQIVELMQVPNEPDRSLTGHMP
jgi:hypothetical protein